MVTQILERVPIEEINKQAREVSFTRTLLALLAALLYALGWGAAKLVAVAWLAAAWSATAVRLGWQEARKGGSRGPAR